MSDLVDQLEKHNMLRSVDDILDEYLILEKVKNGTYASVLEGRRRSDKADVIIKKINK